MAIRFCATTLVMWCLAMAAAVPAAAQQGVAGTPVTVTLTNGTRQSGVLVTLDATEVVIRERSTLAPGGTRDARYPLTSVRRIERAGHAKRTGALIGLGLGLGFGAGLAALGSADEGTFGQWFAVTGPLFAGIGASAGLGIGALRSHLTKSRREIYTGPARLVSVFPIVAPKRAGLVFAVRW